MIVNEVIKIINEEFFCLTWTLIHLKRIIRIINKWLINQYIFKSGWYWKVFIEIKEVKSSLNQIYFILYILKNSKWI